MKVAIYVRVSTEEQAAEGFSISAQRHKLMSYAELQEWDIFDIYTDEGWSGAKLERPELNRLREDMKQGKFDGVLVWKVDRFFRNVYYLSSMLHEMDKQKVFFKSMTESFDTSNPTGKAMLQMMAVFAEWERETIRERVINALGERARQGLHHGPLPFGYDRGEDGVLIPNEIEAPIIRYIFEMRSKGESYTSMVDALVRKWDLTTLKAESKQQLFWNITRIIYNPVYKGDILHQGNPMPGAHDPIVDPEIFELVQSQKGNRYDDKRFYIFKGVLHCGVCGAKMWARMKRDGTRGPGMRPMYFCPNTPAKFVMNARNDHCNGRAIGEKIAVTLVRTLDLLRT